MGKNDNGNNGRTELVFVVDRSGSMGGLESDTIGGFNSMLSKQRTIAGECRVTTLLFDHRIETLHNHLDIREVNDLTSRDYWVRGSTALLDAIGLAIDRMIVTQRHTAAATVLNMCCLSSLLTGMRTRVVDIRCIRSSR